MRISDWSSDVCSSDLMRAIDGHALRLVDRGGIAVIDMGVILQVERDHAAIVQRHGHACRRDVLNRTERSVLYPQRSEEHTSELQSLMRISYAVFCLKKKKFKYLTSRKPISDHSTMRILYTIMQR